MIDTNVRAINKSLHETNDWLEAYMKKCSLDDHEQAYSVMRATFHAIRDRIPEDEATDFAAQLPMIIRGFYFEGFNPEDVPKKIRDENEFFFDYLGSKIADSIDIDPRLAFNKLFELCGEHITSAQVDHVISMFPQDIQTAKAA
jgi:uncharacterized protein (DUF2267 family)